MIQIINCGSFMRRKTDERFHRPAVYVIYKSKNNERLFDRYLLDVSKDVITWNTISDNQVSNPEDILGSSDLIESIMALHSKTSDTPITFSETVRAYLKNNSIGKKLTEVILKALGE